MRNICRHLLHKNISGRLHMATHIPWLMALFLQLQSQQQQVEFFSHRITLASSSTSPFHIKGPFVSTLGPPR